MQVALYSRSWIPNSIWDFREKNLLFIIPFPFFQFCKHLL